MGNQKKQRSKQQTANSKQPQTQNRTVEK